MNAPFPTNTQVPSTAPTLSDILDLWKKNTFLSLFCHGIAVVTDFDPATQTATATMTYSKSFLDRQANGAYVGIQRPYPPLTECPVVFLGGAASFLTFPDVVGAECLVVFNDRDIDNWFVNDGMVLNSSRLHSFSDAILIVGLRSKQNVITDFDTERILLKKGNAEVGVGLNNELIRVANELYTLNGLLQTLISTITSLKVTGVQNGASESVSLDPGTLTNLTTLASQFNGLLE